MEKVIETVLMLAAMIFVMFGREVSLVPKMMGTISGVLSTLAMLAAGAPTGASLATGLVVASLLGEVFDYMLEH